MNSIIHFNFKKHIYIFFFFNLKQINSKRTLVNSYKDIILVTSHFLSDIVYQQQLKNRDAFQYYPKIVEQKALVG